MPVAELAALPLFDVHRYVEVVHERFVAMLDTFHRPIDLRERLCVQLLPVNPYRARMVCPGKCST